MLKKLSHTDSAALSLLNEDSLPQRRFHTPISRVLSSLLNRGGVVEALGAIVSGRQGPVPTPGEIPSSFSSLGVRVFQPSQVNQLCFQDQAGCARSPSPRQLGCQACLPGSPGIPSGCCSRFRLEGSWAVLNSAQAPCSPTHSVFSRTFSPSQDICHSVTPYPSSPATSPGLLLQHACFSC